MMLPRPLPANEGDMRGKARGNHKNRYLFRYSFPAESSTWLTSDSLMLGFR